MEQNESWQRLLRDALAALALSADEQVQVNGPGCVACDLLADFDHALQSADVTENGQVSESQADSLQTIGAVARAMQTSDIECFNNEVLRRPVWQELRDLAAEALREFGWEGAKVPPFQETEPGVWRRPDGSRKQPK